MGNEDSSSKLGLGILGCAAIARKIVRGVSKSLTVGASYHFWLDPQSLRQQYLHPCLPEAFAASRWALDCPAVLVVTTSEVMTQISFACLVLLGNSRLRLCRGVRSDSMQAVANLGRSRA